MTPARYSAPAVRLGERVVERHEHDAVAEPDEQLEDPEHPHRAGVLVRHGHLVVGDEHGAAAVAVLRALPPGPDRARARLGEVVAQLDAPLVDEDAAVELLVALHTGGDVRAVGDAFVVHDDRRGLDHRPVPGRPHGEREVGVLVVGGREARVEAADALEQVAADQQGRAGAVVDVAQGLVPGRVRRLQPAVVPAGAVGPDDAAALLQAAVRVDELRADEPDVRARLDDADELVEPARRDLGVVVQEEDEVAAGVFGAEVAGADEPEVLRRADQPDPGAAA